MINRDVGIIIHSDKTLLDIREKQADYQIEPFVLDFLEIWTLIHEQIKHQTLDTALEFLRSIWESHTYPLYKKYKKKGVLEYNKEWGREFASIILVWGTRGSILFPSDILIYEIYCYKDKLFEEYLQRLFSKQVRGNSLSYLNI